MAGNRAHHILASQQIASGAPCSLFDLQINKAAAGQKATLYNGQDATGPVVAVIDLDTVRPLKFGRAGCFFDTGIYVGISGGTPDLTLVCDISPGPMVTPPAGPPIMPTIGWWDTSDVSSLTVAAGLCSQMNDKSGNAHHMLSSGANRPTSGVDTINGLNVLQFSGTKMDATIPSQVTPATVVCVAKLSTTAATQRSIFAFVGTSIGGVYQQASGSGVWNFYTGSFGNGTTPTDTTAHVFALRCNANSSTLYLDNVSKSVGGGSGTGTSTQFEIGNSSWLGDIGEVLAFNTLLTTGDLTTLYGYLKPKWGTS